MNRVSVFGPVIAPNGLKNLIGLDDIKEKANIAIKSCLKRQATFPHTLLTGQGGLGKTALARAIAQDLNYYFEEVEAMAFKSRNDIVSRLTDATSVAEFMSKRLLFFVDEVHRLSLEEQETFYYPMKEFRITTNKGIINLPEFTLFAATTREDLIDQASFASRFSNNWKLKPYKINDISCIVLNALNLNGITAAQPEILAIARRCLGNPRIAVKYSDLVRDQVLANDKYYVTMKDVEKVFSREKIDPNGLNEDQIKYLNVLNMVESPRGLALLGSALGLHALIVETIVEPPLIYYGLVDRTASGRILTDKGKKYVAWSNMNRV